MTTQTFRWCSQNEDYRQQFRGSNGTIYTVTCNKTNEGPYGINWHCTCRGWQFRRKCHHQRDALHRRCSYGHTGMVGSPVEMGDECPLCGSKTTVVEIAT